MAFLTFRGKNGVEAGWASGDKISYWSNLDGSFHTEIHFPGFLSDSGLPLKLLVLMAPDAKEGVSVFSRQRSPFSPHPKHDTATRVLLQSPRKVSAPLRSQRNTTNPPSTSAKQYQTRQTSEVPAQLCAH